MCCVLIQAQKSAVDCVKSSLELTLCTPVQTTALLHRAQFARANLRTDMLRHSFCSILRNEQNLQVLTHLLTNNKQPLALGKTCDRTLQRIDKAVNQIRTSNIHFRV